MSLGLLQVAGFGFLIVAFAVVLFLIFLIASAVRIVNEYERGPLPASFSCLLFSRRW